MKRCLTGFLALLLLLSLCACGEPQQTEQTGQEPEETTQPQQTGEEPEEITQPEEPPFDPVVPASQAVSADWFQDAAFIGDSVSVMLETYNNSYGRLGSPAFFCSVSLSQTGALTYSAGSERLPEYPKGSGRHPRLEDGVAESGATKIYVMLGMNCIAGGVDRSCQDLVTLIDEILAKSPQATIFVQSVTPMTADSPRADDSLNNTTIQAFNTQMQRICQEREWYYVNTAEALSDETGCLRADFSGDKAMGIHLNYDGAAAWTDYLLTHVPEALK